MRPELVTALLTLAPMSAFAAPLPAGAPSLPASVEVPDDAPDGAFVDPDALAPPEGVVTKRPPISYIVNGVEAHEGEYPEVVFIAMDSGSSEATCTGTLIDPSWVLTAGHCVAHDKKTELAKAVTVMWGNVGTSPERTVQADNWFAHPKWDPTKQTFEGDVALVHLSEPVNDAIMPLNAVHMDGSWIDQDLTFIGYGITKSGGTGSGIKRYTDEPIVAIPSDFLVQTFDGKHSTCQGDSGGPGVLKTSGGYVQASVTSHGIGCADGRSGHMRVDTYLQWIIDSIAPSGGTVTTAAAAPPSFACSRQIDPTAQDSTSVGIIPFDLTCTLQYNQLPELKQVTWSWGDGTTTVEDAPGRHTTHTYATPGNFTVQMCAEGERTGGAAPVPWEHCVQRSSLVRSCGLAEVEFQVEQDDGLTYRFMNFTNLRTSFGCVFNVEWDVFAGTDTTAEPVDRVISWEPVYTFPDAGEYTVVLNVGGIAGTAAAKATIEAKPSGGTKGRCDQTGLPAGALLALAGIAAVRRRKR